MSQESNRQFAYPATLEGQIMEWHNRHALGPEELDERLRRFESYKQALYWKAVAEYEKGKEHQYRGFGVGAAALAFRPDKDIWDGQAEVFTGHNIMPEKGGPKHCAEKRLFEAAAQAGYKQIVGMIVVGEYQPDDISGHICTTLHPCALCRDMMLQSPLSWPDMPIITAQPPPFEDQTTGAWSPLQERHMLREIISIHSK